MPAFTWLSGRGKLFAMSELDAGTESAKPEITLGMIRAGVARLREWGTEEEEPEALVWAICEAALAAKPKCRRPTRQILFAAPPQAVLRLVTTSGSLLSQATLSEQGRPTLVERAETERHRLGLHPPTPDGHADHSDLC